MKKGLFLVVASAALLLSSCASSIKTASKNAVAFPGMTVSRADYKLSADVNAEVEVKEFTTLFGFFKNVKITGEEKNVVRKGLVSGYNVDEAGKIALYKLLEANPDFDYLTNIRIQKTFTKKFLLFFTKYNTTVTVTAKGITLKTEK